MKAWRAPWRALAVIMVCCTPCWSAAGEVMLVGMFSANQPGPRPPDGWKPLLFKKVPKPTHYELIDDAGTVVVKASSDASASGLTKQVRIDPREYPIIRWRWKIENLLRSSDVRKKAGDDYPARLYITFEYDPDKVSFAKKLKYKAGRVLFGDIPIAALNYIWETRTPVGTIVENAYTDFAQMIVLESGPRNIGRWVNEERNLEEDYRQAFGEEPPFINGIAIMSDTDDTKERVVAYYGDIQFVRRAR